MELFGSSLVDMMERDMKDSIYDSVYYPSLGSSPLFPDLIGPVGTLDCSLDHLDPGIMVDPAVVVPRRHTEQHHQAVRPVTSKSREDFSLSDLVSNSNSITVEMEESSEDDDEDDDDERIGEALPVAAAGLARVAEHKTEVSVVSHENNQIAENKRKIQLQHQHWTMVVNKKAGQKVVSSVLKVKREVERSPSLTRSPSSGQTVRSPGVVRSPSVVRSPGVMRTTSITDSPPYNSKRYIPSTFPKPAYSYSCLIAMALKNSPSGSLPVSEIYNFMCEHFPYFKSAPPGWKNSVRHNLSLNKCFEKIEKSLHGGSRKGCLWALNPDRMAKMDEEVAKWRKKDLEAITLAMARPETLDRLERGDMKIKLRVVKDEEDDEEDEEEVTLPSGRLGTITSSRHTFIKEEGGDTPPPTLRLSGVNGRHVFIKEEEEDEDDEDEIPRHRLNNLGAARHVVINDEEEEEDDIPMSKYCTGRRVNIKEEEEEDMQSTKYCTGRRVVIKEEEEEEEEEDDVSAMPRHRLAPVSSAQHHLDEEDDEDEDDEEEEEEDQSQDDQSDEEGEIPPSLKPFDRQLNSRLNPAIEQTDIGVEFSEEVYEELGLLEEVLEEEAEVYRVPVKRSRLERPAAPSQSYHKQAIASLL